ncbi:hypothetical protein OG205_19185 [Lentzea sp. NBC_00516]|uniref:hypothetical protein n=1 Tax=Lentzea sp. NBC_00516 TaxID=2903582 RepID=UPI002E81A3FD|nr:hypothetical protein [Lentzea sp. NBC_00516]WUD29044.1 hypothetical protein OG205_19185 [Lentzea sp. NBC_00516]
MTGESACAREFTALRGRRVESWVGVEWALRADVPGSGPQFHDPEVPCLQLWGLQAVLGDGLFSICTFDEEAVSGLWRNRHEEFEAKLQDSVLWDEPGDCTRWRALSELPVGPIDEVTVYGDEGVVAEVLLVIGGRPLLLIAGELYETWTDDLEFHRLDESVLAFTDLAAADRVAWSTPRQDLRVL